MNDTRRAFLLAALAAACAPSSPPAARPALWRAVDRTNLFLFASAHALPPGLAWRDARIEAALAAAGRLVLEADPAPGAAFTALVRAEGLGPPARLSREGPAAAALSRQAPGLGLDPASLAAMRPWLAALNIAEAQARAAGLSSRHGVEANLTMQAAALRLPVAYLETPEDQIRALAALSPSAESALLAATLRQAEAAPEILARSTRAWAAGDLRALERLTLPSLREAGPEVFEAIIARRNRAFAAAIASYAARRTGAFIAMGAAHLLGDESVPALLHARGLNFTRL